MDRRRVVGRGIPYCGGHAVDNLTGGDTMNKTVVFLVLALTAAALAAWRVLASPETPRPVVVGVVQYMANNLDTLAGFKTAMADFGLVEGRDLVYLAPGPAKSRAELDRQLDQVLCRAPDILLASPTLAAQAAKAATAQNRIPVIFAPVNDPVSSGVVGNLRHPEANVTGVRLPPSEGRRLQALLQLAPQARKVFVPYSPSEASALESLRQTREAAEALGVELALAPIRPASNPVIAADMVPPDCGAIFLPREGLVLSRVKAFMAVAEALRLPMSSPRLDHVEQGVLTGYGFSGMEIGRQAARMARLALSGVKPSGIPVETSHEYLAVNLDAAARIGLTVPDSFLRQAQRIITARQGETTP